MKKLWSICVYVFRFKRKGYSFHKGFWRTRKFKSGYGKREEYKKPQLSYIRPHWKKTADQTWRKRKAMENLREEVTIDRG